MTKIIKADHCGFCFGVRRAVNLTEKTLAKNTDKNVYSLGQIIHNNIVTDKLKMQGLAIVNDLADLKEADILIIRSHGAEKSIFDLGRERSIEIIDATCPYVTKIHKLVEEATNEGRDVIVIGDPDHPEVKGIVGWSKNPERVTVIRETDPIENYKDINGKDLLVVAQTTSNREKYSEICKFLKDLNLNIEIADTICDATKDRQEATERLAKECDLMVVVGGKNSSNSRKLAEIAERHCERTVFIENYDEFPLKNIGNYSNIGVAAGASTPVSAIEEVISNMSEVITNGQEKNEMEDYLEAIEKSLRLPKQGEIVEGKVFQVCEEEVIVDLGCKKDGIIPKDELCLEENQCISDAFKEGDTIQAKVIKTDDGDGTILLSKKKLQANENWEEVNQAMDDSETISVKVVRVVNGGVIASYKEVSGFIPLSQLSDRFVENAEGFIGQVLPVKISRVDKYKGKAVFSHKAFLQEERQSKMAEIWEKVNVGDIIEGEIMRFTDYGAFVDIGGIDGLLHISEISWGKLRHPEEVLSIGEKIRVKILSMNAERGKISLGLKQTQPEPWSTIEDKYKVGQVITGKIVQIKEYGAFVELEPGLDGLVHISEVAHKRVTDLNDELKIGQEVSSKILEIDKEKKRISLSIKETLEPPIFEEEVKKPEETAEELSEGTAEGTAEETAEETAVAIKEKAEVAIKEKAEVVLVEETEEETKLAEDAEEEAEQAEDAEEEAEQES